MLACYKLYSRDTIIIWLTNTAFICFYSEIQSLIDCEIQRLSKLGGDQKLRVSEKVFLAQIVNICNEGSGGGYVLTITVATGNRS